MDENKPKNQSSDEIDLSQVFKWIGNGFRNFGNSILRGLAGIRSMFFENKIFFGLVIISGLGIGWVYSGYFNKKFYKSSMILNCAYLNQKIVEGTIEKLNLLCAEQEREGLAKELGISLIDAKYIINFEAKPFVSESDVVEMAVLNEQLNNVVASKKELAEKIMSKLNLNNRSSYKISILIAEPDVIPSIDTAIVNYFRSGNYIKRRIEITRAGLLLKKEKLIQQGKSLDSLKSVLFRSVDNMAKQSKQGSNNVILSEKSLTDPISVFVQDVNFYDQILSIDRELYLNTDFEVVDGFKSFKEPENASIARVLAIAFIISWLAGYFILGLYKFDRYLAKLSKESN